MRASNGISHRRSLAALAVLLLFVLVALVVILFRMIMQPEAPRWDRYLSPGVDVVAVINGPGEGAVPFFSGPMGVATGPNGDIYVADSKNNRVCVFSRDGEFKFEFGGLGIAKPAPEARKTWQPGLFNYPVGIDCDDDGDVYVADFYNNQIQVFDAQGTFLRAFPDRDAVVGKGSSGQGGTGIAVTDVSVVDGRVYATDAYQIFVFTTEGEYVAQFGRPGRAPGELDHPNGVVADRRGMVYVSDSNHARVTAFTQDGAPVWTVGAVPESLDDQEDSVFGLPRGLCIAENGTIYVTDAFQFGLVELGPDGSVAHQHGIRGSTPGTFDFPNDVEVSGRNLVVADKGNNRVQVVRLDEDDISLD